MASVCLNILDVRAGLLVFEGCCMQGCQLVEKGPGYFPMQIKGDVPGNCSASGPDLLAIAHHLICRKARFPHSPLLSQET